MTNLGLEDPTFDVHDGVSELRPRAGSIVTFNAQRTRGDRWMRTEEGCLRDLSRKLALIQKTEGIVDRSVQ